MSAHLPPNVLWICTDQQRYDTLGCYGNEFVRTPSVDGLAADGVRFERCYSQSPVCTPSRASMLTGRYPRTTRCRQNGQALPDDETVVPRALAAAGYATGLAGKLHLAPCQPDALDPETNVERRIDDGYRTFHWSHHPTHDVPTNDYLRWLRTRDVDFRDDLYVDDSTGAVRIDRSSSYGGPVADSEYVQVSLPAEHHQSTWCADRAIEFVEAHADEQPWFFSVNFFDPHHAFDPPADYLDRYVDRLDEIPLPTRRDGEHADAPPPRREDTHGAYNKAGYYPAADMADAEHRLVRAAYWAMVDLIDDQVGRLLDALARTDQRRDTLVVFTSDHGEMLGDHDLYLKGPYFYEEAVRVPLVLSWPGTVDARESVSSPVELADLAPTVLDAAGVGPLPRMQAESLWPGLRGERDLDSHREDAYAEYYDATANYADRESAPAGTMIRTDQFKLVRWHSSDGGELYDLEADPDELHDRWDDPEYAEAKRDLLCRLADRMADTVDPLPPREASW